MSSVQTVREAPNPGYLKYLQGFFAAHRMAETLLARLSRWERERIILPLQSWSALTLPAQFLGLSVAGEVVLLTFAILYWCEHHTHDARARAHTHARTRRTDGNARAHAQIHARAQMRTRCGCSCCIDIRRRRSTQTRTNAIIQWNVSARTYPPAQRDDNPLAPPPPPHRFPPQGVWTSTSACVVSGSCRSTRSPMESSSGAPGGADQRGTTRGSSYTPSPPSSPSPPHTHRCERIGVECEGNMGSCMWPKSVWDLFLPGAREQLRKKKCHRVRDHV